MILQIKKTHLPPPLHHHELVQLLLVDPFQTTLRGQQGLHNIIKIYRIINAFTISSDKRKIYLHNVTARCFLNDSTDPLLFIVHKKRNLAIPIIYDEINKVVI